MYVFFDKGGLIITDKWVAFDGTRVRTSSISGAFTTSTAPLGRILAGTLVTLSAVFLSLLIYVWSWEWWISIMLGSFLTPVGIFFATRSSQKDLWVTCYGIEICLLCAADDLTVGRVERALKRAIEEAHSQERRSDAVVSLPTDRPNIGPRVLPAGLMDGSPFPSVASPGDPGRQTRPGARA
jgi:hypothetical protein